MRKFTIEFDHDIPPNVVARYARMAYVEYTHNTLASVDVGQGEHFNGLPLGWIGVYDKDPARARR